MQHMAAALAQIAQTQCETLRKALSPKSGTSKFGPDVLTFKVPVLRGGGIKSACLKQVVSPLLCHGCTRGDPTGHLHPLEGV